LSMCCILGIVVSLGGLLCISRDVRTLLSIAVKNTHVRWLSSRSAPLTHEPRS
jgi:hypothetical protein